MKVLIFLLFASLPAMAQEISCRSHTYGDSIYEIIVNTQTKQALIIGSDRWYRTDFLKEIISDLTIVESDDLLIVTGRNLKMKIDQYSNKNFGSPAIYKTMKLDFDCRN